MKDTILLSLDTSSTATGYAVFTNGEYTSCGELISNGKHEQKRNCMILLLENLIERIKPDIIIIE